MIALTGHVEVAQKKGKQPIVPIVELPAWTYHPWLNFPLPLVCLGTRYSEKFGLFFLDIEVFISERNFEASPTTRERFSFCSITRRCSVAYLRFNQSREFFRCWSNCQWHYPTSPWEYRCQSVLLSNVSKRASAFRIV